MIKFILNKESRFPMNKYTDEQLYKLAKKRVFARKAFNIHLGLYIVISVMLFILSISNKLNWFIFPVVGWGIGVLAHKISLSTFLNSQNDIENEFMALKKQNETKA